MSPLIVILLILAGILGIIAFIVWRVLTAPIPPPVQPPETQTTPLFETAPSEQVRLDAPPVQEECTCPSGTGTKLLVAAVAVRAVSCLITRGHLHPFGLAYLVGKAVSRDVNPPVMTGGDECLGRNRASLKHKEREVPTLRVAVSAHGRVELEGRETSLTELEARLAELKSKRGTVHYSCEPADHASPQAAQVLGCILKAGVPVTFSGKAGQSDEPAATQQL